MRAFWRGAARCEGAARRPDPSARRTTSGSSWNTMGLSVSPHSLEDALDELLTPNVGVMALQELRSRPVLTSWAQRGFILRLQGHNDRDDDLLWTELVIREDVFDKAQRMEAGSRWQSVMFTSSGTSTRVTTVHLQPRAQYETYMASLMQMQGLHRGDKATEHTILGDFNTRPSKAEFRSLHEARFSERFEEEEAYHSAADQRGRWLAGWLRSENMQCGLKDATFATHTWKRSTGDERAQIDFFFVRG